jgi:hypothetical protein
VESLVLEDEAPAEEAASLPASAQPVTGHSYKWPGQMENHFKNKKWNIYQMSSSVVFAAISSVFQTKYSTFMWLGLANRICCFH